MKEKISIIIPVYNGEATLKRCLDSVLNQTYRNLEVIVVNDGSTDGTADILKQYYDDRLVILTQENRGQGMARNRAMELATGTYIGFVDSDDAVDPVMYESMIALALNYRADVVQCNIFDVFNDVYRVQLLPITAVVDRKKEPEYYHKYVADNIHSYEVCNKLFRAQFLKDSGLKFGDTKKIQSEDLLFNLEMILSMGVIVFLETPYYYYYQYDNSHSKRVSVDSIQRLDGLFQMFLQEEKARELSDQICSVAIPILMVNLSNLYKKCGRECLKFFRQFVCSKSMRFYMKGSRKSSHRNLHKFLMTILLWAPPDLKVYMIRRHYDIKRLTKAGEKYYVQNIRHYSDI